MFYNLGIQFWEKNSAIELCFVNLINCSCFYIGQELGFWVEFYAYFVTNVYLGFIDLNIVIFLNLFSLATSSVKFHICRWNTAWETDKQNWCSIAYILIEGVRHIACKQVKYVNDSDS